MTLVLVNIFEVSVVENIGDPLCNPFLDADFCEEEDVMSVGFLLGVAVGFDFWIDGAGIGADKICGRS